MVGIKSVGSNYFFFFSHPLHKCIVGYSLCILILKYWYTATLWNTQTIWRDSIFCEPQPLLLLSFPLEVLTKGLKVLKFVSQKCADTTFTGQVHWQVKPAVDRRATLSNVADAASVNLIYFLALIGGPPAMKGSVPLDFSPYITACTQMLVIALKMRFIAHVCVFFVNDWTSLSKNDSKNWIQLRSLEQRKGCFISLDFIIFYRSSRSLNTPTITFNGSHLIFVRENNREINLSPKAMCVHLARLCVHIQILWLIWKTHPTCLWSWQSVPGA